MKYVIISLLLLSVLVTSSITFDDAYANVNNSTRVVINDVNINYNPITHDVLVDWNFGVQDDRTCYSKTNLGIDYRDEKGELIEDPFHTFFGTDFTLYDVYSMFETDIVNEDMALISCEGDFTFNITDFQLLSNFSGFEFWMSFYEKIDGKPQILNEVSMFYSEDRKLTSKTCFANTPDLYTDIYYDTRKHFKIVADEANNRCHRSDKQYDDVIPVVYTSVDSIHYEDYPPYNTHHTQNTDDTPKKTGGGGSPPPPPTFGKNKNYVLVVENGFCFNGNCVDVDKYHTDFPLIIAPVGEVSNITTKAYNPHGVNQFKWVQFCLGSPGVGEPFNDCEVVITVYLSQTEIKEIVIREKQEPFEDKYNLIEVTEISTQIVNCRDDSASKCLQVSLDFIPRDELIHNTVAINVVNMKRSSATNFINHGVEFHGESLNEPLISQVSVSKGGALYPQTRGTVELTLVSYKDDSWQDVYGYMWEGDNYKSFNIVSTIPVPIKEPDLEWSVMTRMNSNFDAMIIHEQERAVLIFDAGELISIPAESWTYDLPRTNEEIQKELDIRIAFEAERAEKELAEYFDYIYSDKVHD